MHKEGGARATKRKNVNCTRKGKEGGRGKKKKRTNQVHAVKGTKGNVPDLTQGSQ